MNAPRASLLERFDRRVDDGGRAAALRSIARNCREVLGTVVGAALACPELGMPPRDVLIQLCPDELALVRRLIQTNLARYEPRLARVAVDVIEEDGSEIYHRQLFLVRASLVQSKEPIQLVVALDAAGRFAVEVVR